MSQSRFVASYPMDTRLGSNNRKKIIVLYDGDGRKYITSSTAKALGFSPQVTIKSLPLENAELLYKYYSINATGGFRLLTESEHDWIKENFIISPGVIEHINVIMYQGKYFVEQHIYTDIFGLANRTYDFGEGFSKCVLINEQQKQIIDKYYSAKYLKKEMRDPSLNERNNRIIMVFYDDRDRKFITTSTAIELGLPAPETIKSLSLENAQILYEYYGISTTGGFRLLTEPEYNRIKNNFVISSGRVSDKDKLIKEKPHGSEEKSSIDVIVYQNSYYLQRHIYGSIFGVAYTLYNFDNDPFECVQLNAEQMGVIREKYIINYLYRYNLNGIKKPSTDTIHDPHFEESKNKHF